jgi:hypothetical protein
MSAGRRITVRKDDVLVINGLELDVATLREMLSAKRRVLWAFVRQGGDVRPVCYDETRVIWLTEEDLERSPNEVL